MHTWIREAEMGDPSIELGGAASLPDLIQPSLKHSMDVNALNFCRFALLRESPPLIALPNLVDSRTV